MSIFTRFLRSNQVPKRDTAKLAKERLQIIVSHERSQRNEADFLPLLQQELVDVIAKYVDIDKEQVKVELERVGERSVLELNIDLPEMPKLRKTQAEAVVET